MIPATATSPPRSTDVLPRLLEDLVAAVKQAGAQGRHPRRDEEERGDQLAPKYEKAMSRYPVGQCRDRVGVNIEAVYMKLVKKS